jgi:hypothetical protein
MITPTTAQQRIRSDRAATGQPHACAACQPETAESTTPIVRLGLAGWAIGLAPVAFYLVSHVFSLGASVDWLPIVIHALVIGLIGLVFAEWLVIWATMGCPEAAIDRPRRHLQAPGSIPGIAESASVALNTASGADDAVVLAAAVQTLYAEKV